MVDKNTTVAVYRWREVTILRSIILDRALFCLVRPEQLETDIERAVRDVGHMGTSSWWPKWRARRAFRKLGRVWDESVYDAGWSGQLVVAISKSRDLLEGIDLAGVAPLEPRIRDEYDDIIFAVMAKIINGDPKPLHSWVAMVYGVDAGTFDDAPIRSALENVEAQLRGARYPSISS